MHNNTGIVDGKKHILKNVKLLNPQNFLVAEMHDIQCLTNRFGGENNVDTKHVESIV